MSTEKWHLKLQKWADQDYATITLGDSTGCGENGDYMSMVGFCSADRAELMASAPQLKAQRDRLVEALKAIKEHQEMHVRGIGKEMSTTWQIADKALAEVKDKVCG